MSEAARIGEVLDIFSKLPGHVYVDTRTLDGFGHENLHLPTSFELGAPILLLKALAAGWSARVAPMTWDGGYWCALPALFAVWRPFTEHALTTEGQAAVTAGLALMPPPSVLVDAGPEIWASWVLDTPITNLPIARAALRSLAARVGGDGEMFGALDQPTCVDPLLLERLTLPLGGPIRNWFTEPREYISVAAVDLTRRYSLDSLLSVGEPHVCA